MGGSFAGTSDSPALKAVTQGPGAGDVSQTWYMSPSAQSDICLKPGLQRHPSACRHQHPHLNGWWANAPGCSIWDGLPLSPAVLLVWPWPGWSHHWLSWVQPCPDHINATWGHALGRKCGWRAGPDLSLAWSDTPPAQTSSCTSWCLPCRALDAASGVWSCAGAGGKSSLSCAGSSQSCAKPALRSSIAL